MHCNYCVVALLAVGIISSVCNGGHAPNVVNTFACDPTLVEQIQISTPCGGISSPSYPQPTTGMMEGYKSWLVNPGNKKRQVVGYRLTFHDFNVGSLSTLIIGNSARTSGSGILKVAGDIIIIQGNGATDGGITIVQGRNKLYKSNGDSFDVNFSKMFITLKQSTSKTQPGALFSITYCADFDKCHEQENYCKNSGTCIRDGFNKYQCSCNAGYSGRHCESDIDECASGLHSCPEDSKCKNSDGGFYCTDKRGAIVHRSSFGKTSNKSVVELCGSNPSSGLRKCEASRCVRRARAEDAGCNIPPPLSLQTTASSGYSSYLGMPRINFGGGINYDAATSNNKKCAFENEFFSVSQLSTNMIGVVQETNQYNRFPFGNRNWNPDGSNHFTFPNSTVTSTCTSEGCATTDDIIGALFKGETSGTLIDLDVDWMFPEIWGFTVYIPGMLKGKYKPAAAQLLSTRNSTADPEIQGYAIGNAGRFKSKITDIQWESDYYKAMFGSAETLSIRFVMDLYNQYSHMSRIIGTIGLTSDNDPLEVTGGRLLLPEDPNLGPTPVYYDTVAKKVSLDLSMSFEGEVDGNFHISDTVYVGVVDGACTKSVEECITPLNSNGALPLNGRDWYEVYGAMVDVDVTETEVDVSSSRIALYYDDGSTRTLIAVESDNGIQIGLANNNYERLNVGETADYNPFITQFGEPVVGASIEVALLPEMSSVDCSRPTCFNELLVPTDVITKHLNPMFPYLVSNTLQRPFRVGQGYGKQLLGNKEGEWYMEHLLSWYSHRNDSNVLFVFYEDLIQYQEKEIKRIADFLGVAVSDQDVSNIAKETSFESLKEKSNASEKLMNFFRKGKVGDWKNYFTVAQSEKMDALVKEKLADTDIKFIYEL
uniref:uncharacterized protein LOC104266029 n=1 Tax=Ciona intestinalis TaxID=7719 RepID=UPI000EF48ADD|nr:uncharacterized protein LOC104266029 [Ciona intestinalis]|eukprot:XP_009859659.3 uncharacterized protein LOC104266029 [Ciona intestinalis]